MKVSSIVAIAASAAVVSAQLDQIPPCALTCAVSSLGSTGCAPTDIACICKATGFISSLTPCVQTACSASDLEKTIQAATQLCLAASVTLSIPTASATSAQASVSSAASSIYSSISESASSASASASSVYSSISSVASSLSTAYGNATMTTSVSMPTANTTVTTGGPTSVLPTATPTGNAAGRNSVALGALGGVLAFAAALL